MSYRYRVEFAHEDETQPEEGLRHGRGNMEIVTDGPVETQAEKDEVARAVGLKLGKTKIAVLQIIPLEVGEVFVDYNDPSTVYGRVGQMISGYVNDDGVVDISSMDNTK